MVLSSQSPRDGQGRRYMVSRKRSPLRWPWIVVIALGCVGGGLWLWSGAGGGGSADAAQAGESAMPDADPTPQPSAHSPAAASREPVRPVTPSLDLGTPRPAAPATRSASVTPAPTTPPAPQPVRPIIDRESLPSLPTALTQRVQPAAPAGGSAAGVDPRFSRGMTLVAEGQLVEGRRLLSHLLPDEGRTVTPGQAQTIRDTLTSVNRKLVFSPEVLPGDPLVDAYTVQSGDLLARLAPRYKVPYPFIERINGINANRIRVGQKLKMINGPFHARVIKREYRLDLYANGPDGLPLYICSFPVGLGEFDSTPEGKWLVERNRKVANPAWADPRSGKTYGRDDPQNPIGEYWIALEGADETTRGLQGYGIHGTIEPESIGTQASMGCVRLRPEDIRLVYEMLTEGESTVHIVR